MIQQINNEVLRTARAKINANFTELDSRVTALEDNPGIPTGDGSVAGDTHAAASKTPPADSDEIPLIDSASSWGLKKLTWSNLKAALRASFDSVYSTFSGAYSDLSGKPTLGDSASKNVGTTAGTVAAGDHNHSGVYQPAGSYAESSHAHPQSDVANLTTDLAGKLPVSGIAADVNPAGASIAAALASKAAASHSHSDATTGASGFMSASDKTKLDGIEAAADVTDASNVGAAIHGSTAKTTPVDADALPAIDSAASNALKKLTWANLKATLKSYFDTLYQAAGSYAAATHTHAQSDITNLTADLAGKEPTQTAASQAEVEAGTSTDIRKFTPQRIAQAIAALAPAGGGGGETWLTRSRQRLLVAGGTTVYGIGVNNTVKGTASSITASATFPAGSRCTSTATTDNDAGWHTAGILTHTGLLPRFRVALALNTFSAGVQRVFAGFTSNTTSQIAGNDPATHHASFRWSTSASDTNWQCITNDGSGGGTITDSGVAVSASPVGLAIEILASSVKFYINGTLVATHTTNLPSSTVGHLVLTRTLENVAKAIDIAHVAIDEP